MKSNGSFLLTVLMAPVLVTATVCAHASGSSSNTRTEPTMTVRGEWPRYEPVEVPRTNFGYVHTSPPQDQRFSPATSIGTSSNPKECTANPIDRSSGAKIEPETDFIGSGEMPLTMQRTYNSATAAGGHAYSPGGILGEKWRTSFDYSIETTYGYLSYLWRPNGQRVGFRWVTSDRSEEVLEGGVNTNPKSYIEVLSRSAGFPTLLAFHSVDGETEIYQVNQLDRYYSAGKIIERRNAQGVSWKFSYTAAPPYGMLSRVEHSSGRAVTIGGGYISDQAGNSYQYGFSGGNLVSVTKPGTPATVITYHYENSQYPKALTGKSFNGVRYSTFAYDASGRATSSEHAGGVGRHTFVYSGSQGANFQATETNPLGYRSIHLYDQGKKLSVTGEASANCAHRYRSFTYDSNGHEDISVDFVGAQVNSDYDEHGHLLRKVEAVGSPVQRTTSYVWDEARGLLGSVTLEGVSRTGYVYDALNRLTSETVTDLSTGQERVTTHIYTNHANKLLATYKVDGPLPGSGDALMYHYSNVGELLRIENSKGVVITYSNHNGLGLAGRLTDANGAFIEYEYDAAGRILVERTFPNGAAVENRFVYGASGLLDARTASDGSAEYFHYDPARRLVQSDLGDVSGGFAVKRFTYDAMSNPVKIEIGRDN